MVLVLVVVQNQLKCYKMNDVIVLYVHISTQFSAEINMRQHAHTITRLMYARVDVSGGLDQGFVWNFGTARRGSHSLKSLSNGVGNRLAGRT